MDDLQKQIIDNQTIEKSALIVAGTTLISIGGGLVVIPGSQWVGVVILTLGVICLIGRELLKLRQ